MAKAVFHRNQKVWVESVGAWAVIEKIVPVWAKGFDEPVKITYDVGLGREFHSQELKPEDPSDEQILDEQGGKWRILRARNKWQAPEDCAHHPFPGTFPVVVTDRRDWGGWRTPGAEYDRDPLRFERQARLIAAAPNLLKLAADLQAFVGDDPENAPVELVKLAKKAGALVQKVSEQPSQPGPKFEDPPVLAAE